MQYDIALRFWVRGQVVQYDTVPSMSFPLVESCVQVIVSRPSQGPKA